MITEFGFGQWLPDQPDLNNPGLTDCCNVFPVGSAYEPITGPVATGINVMGGAIGATRIVRPDSSQMLAIGTATDLYTAVGDTVTPSLLGLAVSDGFWSFVPFGRMIWAFAPGVTPHYLPDIAVDAEFIPHPGTVPQAATAARVLAGRVEAAQPRIRDCSAHSAELLASRRSSLIAVSKPISNASAKPTAAWASIPTGTKGMTPCIWASWLMRLRKSCRRRWPISAASLV